MQRGDIHSTEEKLQLELAGSLAKAVASGMKIAGNVQETTPEAQYGWGNLSETKWSEPDSMVVLPKWVNMSKDGELQRPQLVSSHKWRKRHDGSACSYDEGFNALRYKTCANLTNGTLPHLSGAWSCCSAAPCRFFDSQLVAPIPCQALDVAGTAEGQGCPHLPGSYVANEEFTLGVSAPFPLQ